MVSPGRAELTLVFYNCSRHKLHTRPLLIVLRGGAFGRASKLELGRNELARLLDYDDELEWSAGQARFHEPAWGSALP